MDKSRINIAILTIFLLSILPCTTAFTVDIQSPETQQELKGMVFMRVLADEAIDEVAFFLNNSPIANVSAQGSDFEASFDTKRFTDGKYELSIKARKASQIVEMQRNIFISNKGPSITVDSEKMGLTILQGFTHSIIFRVLVSIAIITAGLLFFFRFNKKKKANFEARLLKLGDKKRKPIRIKSEDISKILGSAEQYTEKTGYQNKRYKNQNENQDIESEDNGQENNTPENNTPEDRNKIKTEQDSTESSITEQSIKEQDIKSVITNYEPEEHQTQDKQTQTIETKDHLGSIMEKYAQEQHEEEPNIQSMEDLSTESLMHLEFYIKEMKSTGQKDDMISKNLQSQGWPEHILRQLLK